MPDNRKYFFVKHGLDALQVMPRFIWRTGQKEEPPAFKRVKKGDRWIGFAYTTSDLRERPLSQVTGFFECTRESRFGQLPRKAQSPGCKNAWMIEGKLYGKQPGQPVGVPPIDELMGKKHFTIQTLVPIKDEKKFEWVRRYTLKHELNPRDIPFLGREPRNEQEVLAVIICCHQKLGIEKILRVRTAFPDLFVKLKGRTEPVHLEVETYSKSFLLHGHAEHVHNRQFKTDDKAEKKPVGVLCWINNAKTDKKLNNCVYKVYELQTLIRENKKLVW
jgi:hypothetical protein